MIPTRMQAIRKISTEPGLPGTRLEEVPVPVPGPGEVLLKVLATAPCGTDRHIYHADASVAHIITPPRTYGHEFCGEVALLGPAPGRADLAPGDYVSAEMHVVCGTCRPCRANQAHACDNTSILGLHGDGCFAGWVKVPASNVIRLDRKVVPPRTGAFLDALGNAVHTTQYTKLSGATVAVIGYGPIGAMAAAVAAHDGAAHVFIIDRNPVAIARAEAWKKSRPETRVTVVESRSGASTAARVREENHGGVDAVFEMSGAPSAINDALAMARNGGHIALLGLPRKSDVTIERYSRDFIFKGLTVQAIIGRQMYATWDRMLDLLRSGLDVSFVVSEEYDGLERFHDGMAAFDRGDAMKVVFYPHGRPAA